MRKSLGMLGKPVAVPLLCAAMLFLLTPPTLCRAQTNAKGCFPDGNGIDPGLTMSATNMPDTWAPGSSYTVKTTVDAGSDPSFLYWFAQGGCPDAMISAWTQDPKYPNVIGQPATYVHLSNLTYASGSITYQVTVDKGAPTGSIDILLTGILSLHVGDEWVAVIQPPPPPAPPPPPPCPTPTIKSVTPDIWFAGKSYTATIAGDGFTKRTDCPAPQVNITDANNNSVPYSDAKVKDATTLVVAGVEPPASDPTETACVTLGGANLLAVRAGPTAPGSAAANASADPAALPAPGTAGSACTDNNGLTGITVLITTGQIQAQNVTPTLNLQPEQAAIGTSAAQTAHLTIGGTFQIAFGYQQTDGTFQALPSKFDLGTPNLTGNLDDNALFPDNAVFRYTNPVKDAVVLQATHLGTQQLTITPNDTTIPPINMNVVVADPAMLGSSHPEVDGLIYPIADATGIPPSFIKAQMAQESSSKFNPMAYYYEPLSRWVGDIGVVSRGQDLRASTFAQYRFATIKDSKDPALTQGVDVDSDDLATVNNFPCCGSMPTALQIVTQYDSVQNWCKTKGYQVEQQCFDLFKSNDFTAQTSLAASYGYMQMTYVNATTGMHWKGVGGLKNPTLLFDTAANLQSGGGSLILANQFLEQLYAHENPQQAADPDLQINDYNAFIDTFRIPWARYNGKVDGNPYPDKVIARIPAYVVVAAGSIF